MADPFNGSYLTCRSATEAAATPRTLRAIIEDKLDVLLPDTYLVAALTIQNESDTDLKLTHLTSAATHYITIAAGATRQIAPGVRLSLSSIYVNVGADNKALCIECVLE